MSLKRQLEDPRSPLRRLFAERLPGHAAVQARWRHDAGTATGTPLLPPAAAVRPPYDVLGHVLGSLVGWMIAPGTNSATEEGAWLARRTMSTPAVLDGLQEILKGPPPEDLRLAGRYAWWVGLLDRAGRTGLVDEPWYQPLRAVSSVDDLLASAPATWIEDVAAVASANRCHVQDLRARGGLAMSPAFAGSSAVGGADGDLVAGGSLIDLKSTIKASLALRDLQQIIAYALLDWQDEFQIHSVGILSLRYARLVEWTLDDLLSTMGGPPLALVELRASLRRILGN